MGIKSFLFEGKRRSKKINTKSNNNFDYGDISNIFSGNKNDMWQLLSRLRNISDEYKYRYREYDIMEDEVVIQSALELYADDATQLDTRTKRIVSIDSEDVMLQKDLSAFLDSINVEARVWQWAYDLAKYGDLFIKVHKEDHLGNKIFRLEDIEDPSLVMDLWNKGRRVAFAMEEYREYEGIKSRIDLKLVDPDEYVHFMIKKSSKTDKLEVDIKGEVDENGHPKVERYSIVRGTSMLEGVRSIFRILMLLENSLLAARISKASHSRICNIDVGDAVPKKTTEIVNRVKGLFSSKPSFDVESGRYKANRNVRPESDMIFNPVRNGVGTISYMDVGGDFEVKNIMDIEYFNNKLFAGLKTPKAYLGFEESLPGGLGDSTLSRLDIRYSRTIKRIQNPLCLGIKDICMLWLKENGRDEIKYSDFNVIVQGPSSTEELSRIEDMKFRADVVGDTAREMAETMGEYINIPKVYEILFKNYVQNPDLKAELTDEFNKASKRYEEYIENEEEEDGYEG